MTGRLLRKVLNEMNANEAVELLVERMRKPGATRISSTPYTSQICKSCYTSLNLANGERISPLLLSEPIRFA